MLEIDTLLTFLLLGFGVILYLYEIAPEKARPAPPPQVVRRRTSVDPEVRRARRSFTIFLIITCLQAAAFGYSKNEAQRKEELARIEAERLNAERVAADRTVAGRMKELTEVIESSEATIRSLTEQVRSPQSQDSKARLVEQCGSALVYYSFPDDTTFSIEAEGMYLFATFPSGRTTRFTTGLNVRFQFPLDRIEYPNVVRLTMRNGVEANDRTLLLQGTEADKKVAFNGIRGIRNILPERPTLPIKVKVTEIED